MQQSPNHHLRLSAPERGLINDRLHVIRNAVLAVNAAGEHPEPDNNHFQRKPHDMAMPTSFDREQAINEYTANVERNFQQVDTIPVELNTVTEQAAEQEATTMESTARANVKKAHDIDLPLPLEPSDA
jgi:hypothetical protein